ncbi:MAG: HAD family hydrolase [Bacillota bacterium]
MPNPIQVMIFDLDGTLYGDTVHFDYYAQEICQRLPAALAPDFNRDYTAFWRGETALRIGWVYDREHDLVLRLEEDRVTRAQDWAQQEQPADRVSRLYPGPVIIDKQRFISLGDPWWIPACIGFHYGLQRHDTQQAFLVTREFMSGPDFFMAEVPGRTETFRALAERYQLVLATNSPEPDSRAIVDKLGLTPYFARMRFLSEKPMRSLELFRSVAEEFSADYPAILSVGDNLVNEITPARKLGCRTLFIDPHRYGHPGQADWIVSGVPEALQVLRREFLG